MSQYRSVKQDGSVGFSLARPSETSLQNDDGGHAQSYSRIFSHQSFSPLNPRKRHKYSLLGDPSSPFMDTIHKYS